MSRRPVELLAAGAALAFVGWLTWALGYEAYLAPILARRVKLRELIDQVRTQKQWTRQLQSSVARAQARVKALSACFEEVTGHVIRDEGDRLRMAMARDQASKSLKDAVISPAGAATAPLRSSVKILTDPNPELVRLKQEFLDQNPKAAFRKWGVPTSVDVLRYEEQFSLEATSRELFTFVSRLESDPLLIEVTSLRLSGFSAETGVEDRFTATIGISCPSFPADALPDASRR